MTRNAKRASISAATAVIEAVVAYGRAWRQYESTVRELSSMSDRELADLRITRSDIPHIAWDADALGHFDEGARLRQHEANKHAMDSRYAPVSRQAGNVFRVS
jgi:uncharacterized protein YjiS (DUF1127 family)